MKKKHKKDKKDKKDKHKKKKEKENGYSKDDLYLFELGDAHSVSVPDFKHLPESQPLRPNHRSKSLDELRDDAQEITDIMMDNVVKVRDRDGKLDDLCEQAESLYVSTEMFQRTSVQIRRKQWWRNRKMTVLLIVVGSCFLILFIIIIALGASGDI